MPPRARSSGVIIRAGKLGLLLLVLIGGACAQREERSPEVGAPAPPFGARNLQGDSVSLDDFRGKVVLLNFWATWCTPCRHETPFLDSLHARRSGEGLQVVGVSMDAPEARADVEAFVQEYGVRYTVLLDPQMRGLDRYRVLGLPASFLLDRSGILRWMRLGPVSGTDREFLEALESVLP